MKVCCIFVILLLMCMVSTALGTTDEHFDKARFLLDSGRYKEAVDEFKAITKLEPDGSEVVQNARYWVGQCYFRMGQFDEALTTFEKLIVDYPKSAIVPVTKLMISQVQQEKDNEKLKARSDAVSDTGVAVDPKTGVKYTKIKSLTGKSDIIQYNEGLNLSPNGNFLLWGKTVVPLDGSEPFDLVDVTASRGSWSPDGKKIAFYSGGAIWVIPVSPETGRPTESAKKLLDGNYLYQATVKWSPDSEKIAFTRRDKEISGEIWTISVKDGTPARVTSAPTHAQSPIWSPDGKTIAYIGFETVPPSICLIPADGGTPTKAFGYGTNYGRDLLSWSPDGKWLVLVYKGNDTKFWLARLADGREFEINPPREVGYFFSWSSDGKKMLFYRPSYNEKSTLQVVSASGGPSLELGVKLTLWPYEKYWSPDSRMIITGGERKGDDWVFWIVPLTGSDPFPLELDVSIPGEPSPYSLSPDCTKLLLYMKQDDNKGSLWVVPVSLKEARTTGPAVKVFSEWERNPREGASWSPDGTKIVLSQGIQEGDIWIASADGSDPIQLTKAKGGEWYPIWSPDGKMIAYEHLSMPKKGELYVIPASGGESKKILDISHDYRYAYTWSPDSKKLTFISDENKILDIPITGGNTRQIANLKELDVDEVRNLNWSPDGRNLAFLGRNNAKSDADYIFAVPAEGGEATRIVDANSYKASFVWSPDGQWISYDLGIDVKTHPEGAIWELDFDELLKGLKIKD